MAEKEKAETQKAEFKELVHLIEENLYRNHPKAPLPSDPFFLQVNNEATPVLRRFLVDSANDHRAFARLTANRILKLKEEELEFNLKKATHLKESLDIASLMETVSKMQITSTGLYLMILKSQSTKGPITLKFKGGKANDLKLEEGDTERIEVRTSDVFHVDFIVNDGEVQYNIDSIKIAVAELIDKIYYMKAAEKRFLEDLVHKKEVDYEVKVEVKLEMSAQDRIKILNKRHAEVDAIVNEHDKNATFYKDLQASLKISFDEDEQTFKSSIRAHKKARENCCEACRLF